MPPAPSRRKSHGPNRGPAAAAGNRAALLAAGRELFSRDGYLVPMSAVARAAGVGQGVLYRHFPTRIDLALAVFSENIDEVERLAASDSGPGCFLVLWRRLVEQVIESTAFVDALVNAAPRPDWAGDARLETVLTEPLTRAQDAGLVDPGLRPSDVLLLVRLVYGVAVTQPDREAALAETRRAMALVDARLSTALTQP